jgi:hypothetical protein
MTPKSLIHVDLTEITSLEIACHKCGSTFTIPLPKEDMPNAARCLGCATPLWSYTEDTYTVVMGLFRTLSEFQKEAKNKKFPFSLGFSLTQPSDRVSNGRD